MNLLHVSTTKCRGKINSRPEVFFGDSVHGWLLPLLMHNAYSVWRKTEVSEADTDQDIFNIGSWLLPLT